MGQTSATSNLRAGLPLAVSLAFHAGLALLIVGSPAPFSAAPPRRPDAPDRAPDDPPPVTLGLDESSMISLAWLGATEASPNEAPLAEVEQSAFSISAGGSPARPRAESALSPTEAALEAFRLAWSEAMRRASNLHLVEDLPGNLELSDYSEPADPGTPASSVGDLPATEVATADSAAGEGQSFEPGSDEGEPGENADKEADAFSTHEPVDVRLGQVAASHGLEIKTRRPDLSITSRLRGGASNPVVEITFGRNGKVVRVEFLAGRSTGNRELDSGLQAAIYGWTAKGEALTRLAADDPDAGVTVTLRLIF